VMDYEGTPTKRQDRAKGKRSGSHADRALEILADLCASEGRTGYAGVPSGFASVPAEWWRDRFYKRAMPAETQDTKKRAFARAAKLLIGQHLVGMADDRVWIARPNDAVQHDVAETC